jgi:hypothetical protein
MAVRVQSLIGVVGETITYTRVTPGSYSTATRQRTPSVQSATIKAGCGSTGPVRSRDWSSRATGT